MVWIPNFKNPRVGVAGDWAKWLYGGPCSRGVLRVRYASGARPSAMSVTYNGGTLGSTRIGVTTTICGSTTTYLTSSGYNSGLFSHWVDIDIFKAADDGLWSGSVTINMDCAGDSTTGSAYAEIDGGVYSLASMVGFGQSAQTPASCSYTNSVTRSVTVYDDGYVFMS